MDLGEDKVELRPADGKLEARPYLGRSDIWHWVIS